MARPIVFAAAHGVRPMMKRDLAAAKWCKKSRTNCHIIRSDANKW